MFKSPRRRKPYSSFYNKNRNRRRVSPLWLMVSVPLLLIALELLAWILIGLTGKSAELAAYQGEPAIVTAYRLKFLTENKKPIAGLPDRGSLLAKKEIAVGYQLVGKQKTPFWQIGEQGFRDRDPLPLAKPKDEIRIFILGGSTTFGQWNQNDENTIANQLEIRLKARVAQQQSSPDKYRPDMMPIYWTELVKAQALPTKIREGKYRVINAGVPGYTSGNQLAQLAFQILPYKPDAIILLDGYPDVMLPSSETAADIPRVGNFLGNAYGHLWAYLGSSFQQWAEGTNFVKAVQYFWIKPQLSVAQKTLVFNWDNQPLGQYLAKDNGELERRVSRYRENHQQIFRLSAATGIPVVVAVQPEITGRPSSQLSKDEQAILQQLGKEYRDRFPKQYDKFVQANLQLAGAFPNTVKVINFYSLEQKFPVPAFSDAIHLREGANQAIAERLYREIASWKEFQQVPKKADRIKQ